MASSVNRHARPSLGEALRSIAGGETNVLVIQTNTNGQTCLTLVRGRQRTRLSYPIKCEYVVVECSNDNGFVKGGFYKEGRLLFPLKERFNVLKHKPE